MLHLWNIFLLYLSRVLFLVVTDGIFFLQMYPHIRDVFEVSSRYDIISFSFRNIKRNNAQVPLVILLMYELIVFSFNRLLDEISLGFHFCNTMQCNAMEFRAAPYRKLRKFGPFWRFLFNRHLWDNFVNIFVCTGKTNRIVLIHMYLSIWSIFNSQDPKSEKCDSLISASYDPCYSHPAFFSAFNVISLSHLQNWFCLELHFTNSIIQINEKHKVQ